MSIIKKYRKYQLKLREADTSLIRDNVLPVLNEKYADRTKDYDEEIKAVFKSNEELRYKIAAARSSLLEQIFLCKKYERDIKRLRKGINDHFEKYVTEAKCMNKQLKVYFSVESRLDDTLIVYVQFFTQFKKHNDDYSIRLLQNNNGLYELMSAQPELRKVKEIQKKLSEKYDIPGALLFIHEEFKAMKENNHNRQCFY